MTNQKFLKLLEEKPDLLEQICIHVSNGGSIIDLCDTWGIGFSDIHLWLDKKENNKRYVKAVIAQNEWAINRILKELRDISYFDSSAIFNDDHSLKHVSEWPAGAVAAIKTIQVDELFEGTGKDREQVGYVKKVKLIDKVKSIELMMKNLNMLTDRSMVLSGNTDDKDFCDEFFGVNKKEEYE